MLTSAGWCTLLGNVSRTTTNRACGRTPGHRICRRPTSRVRTPSVCVPVGSRRLQPMIRPNDTRVRCVSGGFGFPATCSCTCGFTPARSRIRAASAERSSRPFRSCEATIERTHGKRCTSAVCVTKSSSG